MSFGKSDTSGSSQYENNPWAPAAGALEDAVGDAKDVYGEAIKRDTGYIKEMQDMYKGLMDGGNAINPGEVLNRASQYMDPNMIQGMKDANQQQLEGALASQLGGQVTQGNADSSRSGIAAGLATAESNKNLNNQMLDYQNQLVDRAAGDLERQRDIESKAMGGYLQSLQDESMADYFNANAQRDAFGQYLDSILAIGGMGGSGSSSSQSSTTSMSADGASAMMMMSDEKLKKNIKKVGEYEVEDVDGNEVKADGKDAKKKKKKKTVGKYEYEPTEEGIKKGMKPGKQTGALAQEVKAADAGATMKGEDGFMRVNYAALKEKK
ncbi:hypothetical protein [Vibrio phage vB_VpaP_SJSY21]|nr:hypothetical protein [Vibrio phage vB_VpaP_SJSY21]